MTEQASDLLKKALTLSDQERADLACSLIDSLDATVDEDAASAWDQEIARRIEDLDSGRVKAVAWTWQEIRSRISSKLLRAGVRKGLDQANRGEFIEEVEMDARVKRMFMP
jgi:putative addiction module component (TIGR02574 family)